MAMALFATWQRLRQAEAELAEYRREYGILKVENPKMLHAIPLWTPDPDCWRWRMHFPPGRYDICYATTGIQAEGLPKPEGGFTGDFSGPVAVSAAIYKDPRNGLWKCRISAGDNAVNGTVAAALMDGSVWQTSGVRSNHAAGDRRSTKNRLSYCGNE